MREREKERERGEESTFIKREIMAANPSETVLMSIRAVQ